MNERNVAALEGILKTMLDGDCGNEHHLAEGLAARGVLVPSALTFGDISEMPIPDDFYHGHLDQAYRRDEYTACVAAHLQRVAEGAA